MVFWKSFKLKILNHPQFSIKQNDTKIFKYRNQLLEFFMVEGLKCGWMEIMVADWWGRMESITWLRNIEEGISEQKKIEEQVFLI